MSLQLFQINSLSLPVLICVKKIKCVGSVAQSRSHVWLFVTTWVIAHQAPLSRLFQARTLEWVVNSFTRGPSQPRDLNVCFMSPVLAVGFFTTPHTEKLKEVKESYVKYLNASGLLLKILTWESGVAE